MKFRSLTAPLCALTFLGSPAAAADLPSRKGPIAPPPPPFTWTGFYVGVNAGYAWIDDPVTAYAPSAAGFATGSTAPLEASIVGAGYMHPSSFIGGGQIGFNYQLDRYVFGIEGDIQGLTSDQTRYSGTLIGFTARFNPRKLIDDVDNVQHDWLATIRGRLGWAFMDRALVYATGGLALANMRFSRNLNWSYLDNCPTGADGLEQCHSGSIDPTLVGWVLGGGVEYAVTDRLIAKIEYLHAEFGQSSFSTLNIGKFATSGAVQALTHAVEHSNFDIIRAGVSYKFEWGAPPSL